jgi:hypothetical protein
LLYLLCRRECNSCFRFAPGSEAKCPRMAQCTTRGDASKPYGSSFGGRDWPLQHKQYSTKRDAARSAAPSVPLLQLDSKPLRIDIRYPPSQGQSFSSRMLTLREEIRDHPLTHLFGRICANKGEGGYRCSERLFSFGLHNQLLNAGPFSILLLIDPLQSKIMAAL